MKLNIDGDGVDLLSPLAERELWAFTTAVERLYGERHADIAAGEWLNELSSCKGLPGPMVGQWRQITLATIARLAPGIAATAGPGARSTRTIKRSR